MGCATAFAFENLIVYQKAVDCADHVAAATEQFPRGYGYLADRIKAIKAAHTIDAAPERTAPSNGSWRRKSGQFEFIISIDLLSQNLIQLKADPLTLRPFHDFGTNAILRGCKSRIAALVA